MAIDPFEELDFEELDEAGRRMDEERAEAEGHRMEAEARRKQREADRRAQQTWNARVRRGLPVDEQQGLAQEAMPQQEAAGEQVVELLRRTAEAAEQQGDKLDAIQKELEEIKEKIPGVGVFGE